MCISVKRRRTVVKKEILYMGYIEGGFIFISLVSKSDTRVLSSLRSVTDSQE